MPTYNSDMADILNKVADLLEIEGANEYRVRAYRSAASTVASLSRSVAELVKEGEDLTELEGIGESLAAKIDEIVKTSELQQLKELQQRTPPELAEMLSIPGLGPKRVQTLYEEAGIASLEALKDAARQGEIEDLEGFGEKTERKVAEALANAPDQEARTRLDVAEERVGPLVEYLQEIKGVRRVEVAGSYRRRKETVGDLDILATGEDGERIIERFVEYEDVEEMVSQGETRSTVLLRQGFQVDLRVVAERSYGAALFYLTGSKAHNIAFRNMALNQDLKVNEYGVFRGEERIAGEMEKEIYGLFDMPLIPPELREGRGEIEAAQGGGLPRLVTLEDLRGDLQVHTIASDGHNTLEEMARAARDRGHAYLAITDHSSRVGVTQGLDAGELAQRIEEIDRLNDELDGIEILKGIEVDILEDGSLDLPDGILSRLDVVLCAIHVQFGLSRERQTERLIRAMDNPNFHILAHPTGRLIGERKAYEVDLERVMAAALDRGCFLEVNAHPSRLDVDDIHCRMAKEMGLKLSISTDAHRVSELDALRFGVGQARRGWLEREDVLNARPWKEVQELLKR